MSSWPLEAGNDGVVSLRGRAFCNRGCEHESSCDFSEVSRVWREQLEAEELAAGRSVFGRMGGVGAQHSMKKGSRPLASSFKLSIFQ